MPELEGRLSEGWARVEKAIDAFEQAWLEGRAPRIEEFLPDGDLARTALHEFIQVDLEWRWRSGQAFTVEDYLPRFPHLREDEEALADGGSLEADQGAET